MTRQHPDDARRHRARLLSGALFREPRKHRGGMARALLFTGGIVALVVGVALVVLPVVPGFPLVIIGILMVAASSSLARSMLNRLEQRLPTAVRARIRRLARREQDQFEKRLHPHADASASSGVASDDGRR